MPGTRSIFKQEEPAFWEIVAKKLGSSSGIAPGQRFSQRPFWDTIAGLTSCSAPACIGGCFLRLNAAPESETIGRASGGGRRVRGIV